MLFWIVSPLMAAGTPPDVYWNRQRTSQVLIRRDALADVLPLMKRDKMTQDDYWPSAVKTYSYKGGYFGLPTSSSSNALYFNKIHFKQVGVPLPTDLQKQGKWDWDALLETARKLTRSDATGKKFWGFLRPTGLTLNDAQRLKTFLNNGAFPIPLKVIQQQDVEETAPVQIGQTRK